MKITITRALVELKMLDKKIAQVSEFPFVGVYQKKGKSIINRSESKDDFEKNAKGKMQSLKDLVSRVEKLRLGIAKANAETIVMIGGKEMTIVEVLVFKERIIPILSKVYKSLSRQIGTVNSHIEQQRVQVESAVSDMLERNLGNDRKADKEAYNAIAVPFIEANEFNLSDAADSAKYAENLDSIIQEFQTEVDVALSEANATTFIELED